MSSLWLHDRIERIRCAIAGHPRPRVLSVTVVVPTVGAPRIGGAARHLLDVFRLHARVAADCEDASVLAVDAAARQIWSVETGEWLRARQAWPADLSIILGPAFLLADPPPVAPLIAAAERTGLAWCARPRTTDVYACAVRRAALSRDVLWRALRLLTVTEGETVERAWRDLCDETVIAPAATCADNSPALDGIDGPQGRREFDAPIFVNTAVRELLTAPRDGADASTDGGDIARRPERMAAALLVLRDASRVPWIFNTLLNDIEFRLGSITPRSLPPEVHLSIAGACNIECRFCAYEHAIARRDVVTAGQIAQLDFLRFVQIFRLHSGLGEPTLNRHLPAIVRQIADRFPHVTMNFFTNAVSLGKAPLIEALVGRVRWINASLNAATRESWQTVCGADLFERVTASLRALRGAKRAARALHPLVFGSIVLTRANLEDLPRMPALCRSLGIDRLTAFPYFGLGYHGADKYGPEMTLESCRERYDALYWPTVDAARQEGISLEMPLPGDEKRIAFGREARPLHDFARIEVNQWRLGRFVSHLAYDRPPGAHCDFLWRSAGIGSTNEAGHAAAETHYLYPCIGPLSSLDLSRRTAFRFPGTAGFQQLWQNPVFTLLRQAQHRAGVSRVCDVCRGCDTRDPAHFATLEQLVADFAREHCAIP